MDELLDNTPKIRVKVTRQSFAQPNSVSKSVALNKIEEFAVDRSKTKRFL